MATAIAYLPGGESYSGAGGTYMVTGCCMADPVAVSPDHQHALVWGYGSRVMVDRTLIETPHGMNSRPSCVQFSSTGSRVAFMSGRRDSARQYLYVCDVAGGGIEAAGPYGELRDLRFSQDGAHYVYIASDASGRPRVFVDATARYGPYGSCSDACFRTDGTRVVYAANSGGQWWVYEDDMRRYGPYDHVAGLEVARNDRIIFVASRNGNSFAVVDGVEKNPYSSVAWLSPSPDGSRYGYVAQRDGTDGEILVVDDREQGTYEAVQSLVFSPAGKSWAAIAKVAAEEPRTYQRDDGTVVRTVPSGLDNRQIIVNGTPIVARSYSSLLVLGGPSDGLYDVCVNDAGNRLVYFDRENGKGVNAIVPGVVNYAEACSELLSDASPVFTSDRRVSFAGVATADQNRSGANVVCRYEFDVPPFKTR
jgi:dipeptidyl aminopeptidase/acylaminoacyl peptidase